MSAKVPVPIRAATTAEPGTGTPGSEWLKRKDIHSEGGKEHENSFFERGYRRHTVKTLAYLCGILLNMDESRSIGNCIKRGSFGPSQREMQGACDPRVFYGLRSRRDTWCRKSTFRGRQGTREFVFRERLSNYRPGRTWASPLTPWLFHFLLLSL